MLSELVYPFYSLSRSLSNSINFHHHYSAFRLIVITSVMTMSYLFKPSTRTHHSTDFPQPICVTIATDSNSSELSPNNRSILIFFPLLNLSSTTSDHRVRLTSYGTDTGYSVRRSFFTSLPWNIRFTPFQNLFAQTKSRIKKNAFYKLIYTSYLSRFKNILDSLMLTLIKPINICYSSSNRMVLSFCSHV